MRKRAKMPQRQQILPPSADGISLGAPHSPAYFAREEAAKRRGCPSVLVFALVGKSRVRKT